MLYRRKGEEKMLKIGLVDDDICYLEQMKTYLKRFCEEENVACQIEEFHNGLNFVEDYSGDLDVVFLDIEMPHLNGMEAAKRVREKCTDPQKLDLKI